MAEAAADPHPIPRPMFSTWPNLGETVSPEFDVSCDCVGHPHRDDVGVALDLVDDRVRVGHLTPVVHAGGTVAPNDPVDLFMQLLCQKNSRVTPKATARGGGHLQSPLEEGGGGIQRGLPVLLL